MMKWLRLQLVSCSQHFKENNVSEDTCTDALISLSCRVSICLSMAWLSSRVLSLFEKKLFRTGHSTNRNVNLEKLISGNDVRWQKLHDALKTASTVIHREEIRSYLERAADPTDITFETPPPFQLLVEILCFYQFYRRVESMMSYHYPTATDKTPVFSQEIGPRRVDHTNVITNLENL